MLQLPKVIGHRGAMAYAPENTLASFREARRRGATLGRDRRQADGRWRADRDARRLARSAPWASIGWSPRRRAPSCRPAVPTFEQAIACFRELGLGCNVEIKPCEGREAETARVTVETLRRCWPAALPAPLLSSFKDASLLAALQAAPEFARALLIGELGDDWRARAEAVSAAGINTDGKQLTAPRAVAVRKARLRARSRRSTTAMSRGRWSAWGPTASSPTRPT